MTIALPDSHPAQTSTAISAAAAGFQLRSPAVNATRSGARDPGPRPRNKPSRRSCRARLSLVRLAVRGDQKRHFRERISSETAILSQNVSRLNWLGLQALKAISFGGEDRSSPLTSKESLNKSTDHAVER